MNILYIAYSCDPFNGSEDKIGWNVPIKSAEKNNVFVITKEEHREVITQYLKRQPLRNIHFSFVDIPIIYKKLFKGFLYSGRLNIWNKRAYPVAKKISKNEKIDIIHQITPIEFRSIGDYGKISDTKFVCGPLGGGEQLPASLRDYAIGHMHVENIRRLVNQWYRIKFKLSGLLKRCDYIMYANQETLDFLGEGMNRSTAGYELFFDSGISKGLQDKKKKTVSKCVFLTAGRMIYRKGHDLLLDAIEQLPSDMDYECRIVGDGPEFKRLENRCNESNKLKSHVIFTGKIPFTEMNIEYANADVFVMPSIRETTGSVLLEAMSKGVPVITIMKFGGAALLNKDTGWLYSGDTKNEYVSSLRKALLDCIQHPEEIVRKGQNARIEVEKYTWDEKIKHYNEIYEQLLSGHNMKG